MSIAGSKPWRPPISFVGDFQIEVLRSVQALSKEAYGMNIRRFLEDRIGRNIHMPQIYAALVRLEKLGLISSFVDHKASAGQRGRSRRIYALEAPGQRMLLAGDVVSLSVPETVRKFAPGKTVATT